MAWRTDSLESSLKIAFITCVLLQLAVGALLLLAFAPWSVALITLTSVTLTALLFRRLYLRIVSAFRRAGVQLDALLLQDFSARAKPGWSHGTVAELHRLLDTLADSMQHRRHDEDRQALLLYRLIDQLNTPILIFNERQKLSYGNPACAGLFGRPWETLRNASPSLLGLRSDPEWQFTAPDRAQQWQIRHSRFWDHGQSHQLLVFTNIQDALRESQVRAWQKLIQVMSHEIRNSLTPVVALVQNLQPRAKDEREQQALQVIDERCRHLQDFVKRYAELHIAPAMKEEWLNAQALFDRLADLFPQDRLQVSGAGTQIWADAVLLQQVLINLIRNAQEAGSEPGTIRMIFSAGTQQTEIRVVDRGCGLGATDKLFVPFFTTKPQGKGIGLSLSRHFVEQMGGHLTLTANPDGIGACALIRLPQPTRVSHRPESDDSSPESDARAS